MRIEKDKIMHFTACFCIALLLYPMIGWWSVGTALATGIGKEIYDYKDYGNFSWSDILADSIGVIAGIIVILLIKLVI